MQVTIDVVHPTERQDGSAANVLSWRVRQKPHAGDASFWQDVGGPRAPATTQAVIDNVPAGDYDFEVIWHDADGLDSDPFPLELDVEPPASKPKTGSATIKQTG